MVDVSQAPVVAILTRAPSAEGKSRLFASLGCATDPELLSALLLDTLDGAAAPGVTRIVAVEPPIACDEVRALVPADVQVIAQPGGTLGERMASTMGRLFEGGASRVVLIGSDLPTMTPRLIEGALGALERDPNVIVLGPATDGGYYLIAAAHLPDVFAAIDWGSGSVLVQTTAAAARAGRRVVTLEPMTDVDNADDLRGVLESAGQVPPCAAEWRFPFAIRTCAWARAHGVATRRGNETS